SDKNLQKAFDCLMKFTGNKKSYSRRDLHKKIFAGKKFNDGQVRHLLSDLCRQLEYFFTLRALDNNKLLYQNLCAKALSNHDCEKAYNYVHQSIHTEQKNKNSL